MSGFYSNHARLSLKFNLSEPVIEDFVKSHITTGGGSISSSLTSISDTEYKADFTATPSYTYQQYSVGWCGPRDNTCMNSEILSQFPGAVCRFYDSSSNPSDHGYHYANIPDVETCAQIAYLAGERQYFTHYPSTASNANHRSTCWLTKKDEVCNIGSTSQGAKIYEMTYFTPLKTILVNADILQDKAGNGNLASNTFEWNYDTTAPTIRITAEDRIVLGT